MSKFLKKVLPAVLLIILAAFAITGCGKQKLNLQDNTKVDFSGYDGYGSANASIDVYSLLTLLLANSEDEASWENELRIMYLLEEIKVNLDTSRGLSNGDQVTVTITYPDNLAEKLDVSISPKSGSSWTIEVGGLSNLETIDLFDNMGINCEGYDGYGTITPWDNSTYDLVAELSAYDNAKNGDTVMMTLSAPNGSDLTNYCITQYGVIPAATSKEYFVEGLTEPGEIDLFKDIDISTSGYSPYLSVTIFGAYENDGISYELVEDNEKHAIGDTITIRAYVSGWGKDRDLTEECLNNFGALPTAETYTYTIPDCNYYIMDADQISDDVLDQLISDARDHLDSDLADKDDSLSVNGITYYGYYLQTRKAYNRYETNNRIYIVFSIDYTWDGNSGTRYCVVCFADIIVAHTLTDDSEGDLCSYESASQLYNWGWRLYMDEDDLGVDSLLTFELDYVDSKKVDYETEFVAATTE